MAYETGAASSANDLLDKWRLFCIAAGWTVNQWADVASGKRLHLSKGSLFANLRSYEAASDLDGLNGYGAGGPWSAVGLNMSDAYSGALPVFDQVGAPTSGGYRRGGFLAGLTSAIPAYHFFSYSDSDDVLAVVEYRTGRFQLMGFGSLAKFSTGAAGGAWFSAPSVSPDVPYFEGSGYGPDSYNQNELIPFRRGYITGGGYMPGGGNASSFLRCNVDSNNTWAGSARTATESLTALAALGQAYYDEDLRGYTPSSTGWQTSLLRQTVYVVRADQFASPYGEIRHMRRLEMTNYIPGEEFTLGSDTWKVFPYYQKGGATEQRGYALRKEA